MATINGQLATCDRCGVQVFRKTVGEGETDGGYTRWNKFEPFPEGWCCVEIPSTTNSSGFTNMFVCPECSALWGSILTEHFLNTIKEANQ